MSIITAEEANEREARIERMLAETRKFIAEHDKLAAEATKFKRDSFLAPLALAVSAMAAGAALFGAALAYGRLLHP